MTGDEFGMAAREPGWCLRPAVPEDSPTVVAFRRMMFEAMGYRDVAALDAMADAAGVYFPRAIRTGEYRGWIAEVGGQAVATAGLVIHAVPPSPANLVGQAGYIMNICTAPAWRGRGIASALLDRMLAHLRAEGIPAASLHATDDGRPIYERAGFAPSNEMRIHLADGRDPRLVRRDR